MSVTQIAHYQLLSPLGQGAMGVVYRARDTRLQRDVALKLVQLSAAERASGEHAARLLQEARSAARLNHPGIITVYDCGEWQGQPYMVMELVQGQTLKALLERRAQLSIRQVVSLARQMFDALSHAHRHGVVHRDIKPANLMLDPNGRLKVMDFGIAQLPASDLTRTGTLLGSPRYMAPEQLGGTRIDGRADLFAAGVVLYQALTGQLPFDGEQPIAIAYQILHAEPVPPHELRPDTPEALSALILRCLAKRPDDRYPDAGAALADLTQVRHRDPQRPQGSSTPQPSAQNSDPQRRMHRADNTHQPPAANAPPQSRTLSLLQHIRTPGQRMLQLARTGLARFRQWTPRQQLLGAAVAVLAAALLAAMLLSRPPQTAGIELVTVPDDLPEIRLSPTTDGVAPEDAPALVRAAPSVSPAPLIREQSVQHESTAEEPADLDAISELIAPQPATVPEDSTTAANESKPEFKQELKQAGRDFKQAVNGAWDCLRGRAACPTPPRQSADPREQAGRR